LPYPTTVSGAPPPRSLAGPRRPTQG
jgi:hypothetical protein